MIRSSTLLYDDPCYICVSHAPLPGDSPRTLALADALASDTPLQLGQLGPATHVHPALSGSSSAVVRTLHDPLAFVPTRALRKAMKPRPAYWPLLDLLQFLGPSSARFQAVIHSLSVRFMPKSSLSRLSKSGIWAAPHEWPHLQ